MPPRAGPSPRNGRGRRAVASGPARTFLRRSRTPTAPRPGRRPGEARSRGGGARPASRPGSDREATSPAGSPRSRTGSRSPRTRSASTRAPRRRARDPPLRPGPARLKSGRTSSPTRLGGVRVVQHDRGHANLSLSGSAAEHLLRWPPAPGPTRRPRRHGGKPSGRIPRRGRADRGSRGCPPTRARTRRSARPNAPQRG